MTCALEDSVQNSHFFIWRFQLSVSMLGVNILNRILSSIGISSQKCREFSSDTTAQKHEPNVRSSVGDFFVFAPEAATLRRFPPKTSQAAQSALPSEPAHVRE
jgi:hypothetical protein